MEVERMVFMGSDACLPGYLWTPENRTDAVLLVLHGMTEHAGRYDTFAETMAEQGFAVAAYDLRGHGTHAADSGCAAMAPGDWEKSIDDIDCVIRHLRERFDRQPLYLLGFSLGSFLVREYMEREQILMDGVILIGTGWQPGWLLKAMRAVVKTQIKKAGFEHTTPLIRQLSFGAYNQKFKPNRTASDWLCADTAELDAYLADGLCRGILRQEPSMSCSVPWNGPDGSCKDGKRIRLCRFCCFPATEIRLETSVRASLQFTVN